MQHLKPQLKVRNGQATSPGVKPENEDCLGLRLPSDAQLAIKGVAAVIADGVSVAEAGKQAAEICVQSFLNDYFDAPDTWTVKRAGGEVTRSINNWLFGLGSGFSSPDRGYVSTFSAVVLKSNTAHIFHVGDSRIWQLCGHNLSQLTQDHSVRIGGGPAQLTRAMGLESRVEADYESRLVQAGDAFLLTTDGVHGFVDKEEIEAIVRFGLDDPDAACQRLIDVALERGSNDNLSALLFVVDELVLAGVSEVYRELTRLPFPPDLAPGMKIDGLLVEEEISATSRSQLYRVKCERSGARYVMKTPSVNFEDDPAYLERFVTENWTARRLDHLHLLHAAKREGEAHFLYNLYEYVEGPTLAQWMQQQNEVNIPAVIELVRQVISGVRALHRNDILHQDIKPANVIVHPERGAVIIDYGSCHMSGLEEIQAPFEHLRALGTVTYSAPEYRLGKTPTRLADLFSIGVLAYELLTGQHPYGGAYERATNLRELSCLQYTSTSQYNPLVPEWMDGAIRKAVQINPQLRYQVFSEFEYDLQHPNPKLMDSAWRPLMERGSLKFWKNFALLLLIAQVGTLIILLKLLLG
ncbi:protein kinase domain-containing protein [Cerasicoccus frondis]|uniref:protein kinase domain-containing protein n=1 Tax=Cerasicoccus frondis TaxID=490090 RepID=UPI0028527127|nr:protein kinase [Cerasicoccus frondis]